MVEVVTSRFDFFVYEVIQHLEHLEYIIFNI